MSLLQKLQNLQSDVRSSVLFQRFGVLDNPFPTANQVLQHDHYRLSADEDVENYIQEFVANGKSRAIAIRGTQGVGKTNFMKHFESEIQRALQGFPNMYIVEYLSDPEASFAGTTRRLFEALGDDHLSALVMKLKKNRELIDVAHGYEMKIALRRLCMTDDDDEDKRGLVQELFMQWIRGLRILKDHRIYLGVQFRLDTVESKTAALRDLVHVSLKARVLGGIFLLLDELEKQDGTLGPTAVVRYLSALRAIIDALDLGLFLMIAVTPDALLRYSAALPALRGRLEDQVELYPLKLSDEAVKLAYFYLDVARRSAQVKFPDYNSFANKDILRREEMEACFEHLWNQRDSHAEEGVRQRVYLHELHSRCEVRIREVLKSV